VTRAAHPGGGNGTEGVADANPVIQQLLAIPGIGLLTATALFATVADIHAFKNGRQLACWLGLTPREYSSGGRRRLGPISKQGDPYLHAVRARRALSPECCHQAGQGRQTAHATPGMVIGTGTAKPSQ
jgi:transposase